MTGQKVEILAGSDFYKGMTGTVIEEYPLAVRVEFEFADRVDKVSFLKEQVQLCEKQEREKGCEFCKDDGDYIVKRNGKTMLVLQTYNWNYREDDFDIVELEINCCPMCGRRLEESENG
jgi:hypothetical protein